MQSILEGHLKNNNLYFINSCQQFSLPWLENSGDIHCWLRFMHIFILTGLSCALSWPFKQHPGSFPPTVSYPSTSPHAIWFSAQLIELKLTSFSHNFFSNSGHSANADCATDGAARIFAYHLMPWRDLSPSRVAPDWDLWRMLCRLSCSTAAHSSRRLNHSQFSCTSDHLSPVTILDVLDRKHFDHLGQACIVHFNCQLWKPQKNRLKTLILFEIRCNCTTFFVRRKCNPNGAILFFGLRYLRNKTNVPKLCSLGHSRLI